MGAGKHTEFIHVKDEQEEVCSNWGGGGAVYPQKHVKLKDEGNKKNGIKVSREYHEGSNEALKAEKDIKSMDWKNELPTKERGKSTVQSKLTGKTRSAQPGLRAREVKRRNVPWPDLTIQFQL